MCEVTSANFATLLPQIIEQIDRSCFLAIDTEFSSLSTIVPSLDRFSETIKQLYERRHRLVEQLTIFQFGLAIFSKSPSHEQRYIVHVYNFYLNPTSIEPIDVIFVIQTSSIKFLTKYKFDFNKCFYSGITFLNRTQEQILIEQFNNPNSNYRFPLSEKSSLTTLFEKINTWLITAKFGDTLQYDLNDCVQIDDYLLHGELRRCFKTIWTRTEYETETKKKCLIIEHISRETYDEKIANINWQNDPTFVSFIEPLMGFTRLLRYIENNYRKPIVGHNCFLDWLIIYEKFVDSLPRSFEQFQTVMNTHFPSSAIFDTKYLAFEMKDLLFSRRNRSAEDSSNTSNYVENFTSATSLGSLYELLTSKFYDNAIFFKPTVEFGSDINAERYKNADWKHEAGYDAYMSGVVFLKLLYFYKQKKAIVSDQHGEKQISSIYSNHSASMSNPTFEICLNEMNLFKNRLHAINSSSIIPYVSLNKHDTYNYNRQQLQRLLSLSSNSCCLVVQARDGRQLDMSDIISRFNAYCPMQYNINSNATQLFLTFKSSHCQTIILKDYFNHSLYKVERFHRFKHSILMQCCCTVGTSIILGVVLFFLVKHR